MNMRLNVISAAVAAALTAPVALAEQAAIDPASAKAKQDVEVIVVSGSRLEQNLQNVAGSVSVLTEEDIARNMSTDFATLFRTEAAVDVKGGAGKSTSVTIRGIGGNRVMMVKDGVRVNNQYASPLGPGAEGTGRGLTEVEGLKQVEVVKAAASTIYGSDALGGVVVMQTKDAEDYLLGADHYASVNAGYTGLNDEYAAGFTAAAAYNDFENLIAYQHRTGEEQQNYDKTLPDSDLVTDSVLFKSKYHFNDDTNLQLTLDFLEQNLERWETDVEGTNQAKHEWIDTDRTTKVFNGSLRLRSEKATFMHDNLDLVMYFGSTKQDEWRDYYKHDNAPKDTLTQTRDYGFEEQRYGFTSTFAKYIGHDSYGHNLTYGVDIEQSEMSRPRQYNQITDCNATGAFGKPKCGISNPFAFADTESLRVGAFIQDDITLLDGDLNLVMGLRYDYFRNTPDIQMAVDAGKDAENFAQMSEGFWSPKVGLVYQLTDDVNVYAQYAYGYKMPTPDQKWGELVVEALPGMVEIQINPNYDLESESSHTYEVGVRGNHDNTSYELTAFYISASDYIDWEFTGCEGFLCDMGLGNLQYRYINLDEVTMYGAEMQASHWITDDLKVWGNIAYTHGEDGNGDYLNTISPLKGNVGVNYFDELMGKPLDVALNVHFADHMSRTTDLALVDVDPTGMNKVFNTAGWATVDFTVGVEMTDNLQVRAGVYNLFDKEYVNYADVASLSKGLVNALGSEDGDFTQPGRYAGVNLKYTF
ncbi:TonB-dependent hemoglobin/transferrin/lactoferrin family receptor [Ferrimonas senticii]|uniref:TonB-dependent hemoglobin/transferrin/lactoferrin family receptor n=1 Tax=Ferrimonas senticii TaxID=394566 RepID=UPI0003F8EC3A|nr:TonB-dependent hemoglobin/transferrin/lactoferrin family receptor [Ferrimonas senticii]